MGNENNAPESRRATLSRSTHQLALWTGAWLLTNILMRFGYQLSWADNGFLDLLAMALNIALGVGMILATVRHLRVQDEMERKVFVDAVAVAGGVGLVAAPAFQFYGGLLFALLQPQIPHLIILMGVSFLVSMLVGCRRLR